MRRRDESAWAALRLVRCGLAGVVVGGGLLAGGLGVAGPAGSAGAATGGGGASAAQKAHAKMALLTPSDFPRAWTSSASTTLASGGFTGAPELARCIGVPAQLIRVVPPEVHSLQFSEDGGDVMVQNTVSIFPSARDADQEYAAVASEKTPGCVSSLFNASAGSGLKGGGGGASATVTRVSSPKGTTGFAILIAGSSGSSGSPEGGAVQASGPATRTQTVFFVHGQYGDSISIETVGSQTVPASLVGHIVAASRGRL